MISLWFRLFSLCQSITKLSMNNGEKIIKLQRQPTSSQEYCVGRAEKRLNIEIFHLQFYEVSLWFVGVNWKQELEKQQLIFFKFPLEHVCQQYTYKVRLFESLLCFQLFEVNFCPSSVNYSMFTVALCKFLTVRSL